MDRTVSIILLNVARQLALLPTADVERHVREAEQDLDRAAGFGPLLDPTAYIRAMDAGTFNDAEHQLAIARHLLAARRAIDEREAFVAAKKAGAA